MKLIRLFINNLEADIYDFDDLNVNIIKQSFDVTKINSKNGDYSIGLKIPFTDNNKSVLGFYIDPQLDNFNLFNLLYDARIEINGNTVLKGKMTIDETKMDSLSITIISDNISWIDLIKDKKLTEIQSLKKVRYSGIRSSDLPFPNQVPNTLGMVDLWQLSEDDNDVQFTLKSYGNFPAPSNAPIHILDAYGFDENYYLYNNSEYPLSVFNFTPDVFQRAIIKSIFKDIGYEVNGNYFSNNDFKNKLELYSNSQNAEPLYNWGIMNRVDVEYDITPSGGLTSDLLLTIEPSGLNASFGGFNNANNGGVGAFGATQSMYYFTPKFSSDIFPIPPNNPNITFTQNERYAFDNSWQYRNQTYSGPFQNWDSSLRANVNANYDYIVSLDGLTNSNFNSNNWKLAVFQKGLVAMMVKRNNNSFTGVDGDGLWKFNSAQIGQAVSLNDFDSSVVDFQYFTPAQVQNMGITPLVINLNGTTYLEKGETLELIIGTFIDGYIPVINDSLSFTNNCHVEFKSYNDFDIDYNPAWNLRDDLNQIDYLKSIFNAYNLYVTVDDVNKTVLINQYDYNFLPSSLAVDWSEKCNIEEAVFQPISDIDRIDFKHPEDGMDVFLDEEPVDRDYTFILDYNFNEKDIKIKDIEVHFNPIYERFFQVYSDTNEYINNVPICTIGQRDRLANNIGVLQDGGFPIDYSHTPRVANWLGIEEYQQNFNLFQIYCEDIGLSTSLLNPLPPYYPILPRISSFTLSDQIITYNDFLGDKGLYNKYWSNYILNLSKSILIKLNILLNEKDITDFDSRRYVIIQNQLYIVNKIIYNTAKDELSKVELLKA